MRISSVAVLGTFIALWVGANIIKVLGIGQFGLKLYGVLSFTVLLTLLIAYVATHRKSGGSMPQFSLRAIFVVVTLAAIDAWAWRAGQGLLMTITIIVGSLLFWRVWIRGQEPLNLLSLCLLGILSLGLLLFTFMLGIWFFVGPKVRYDVPITEQKQGVLYERAK